MADDLDFVGIVGKTVEDVSKELMKIELGETGIELDDLLHLEHFSRRRYVSLTRVYKVSYAVLRASRPSSTLCVQGPIWTVRISSRLITVSWYKVGRIVGRCSRIRCGLVRAAEFKADKASRRTVYQSLMSR